jgi:hypothetical protein
MRIIIRMLIVFAVLGGLFVVADRVAVSLAQNALADEVAAEVGGDPADTAASADISGFPFLTQVVGGELDEVTVRVGNVNADGWELRDIELTASSVSVPMSAMVGSSGQIQAGRLEGGGLVTYSSVAAVTNIADLELSAGSDGAADVSVPIGSVLDVVDVAGSTADLLRDLADQSDDPIMLTGTATADVDAGIVRLEIGELSPTDPDRLESAALTVLEQVVSGLSIEIAIPELPYGLSLTSVRPESEGVNITLVGNDVAISR